MTMMTEIVAFPMRGRSTTRSTRAPRAAAPIAAAKSAATKGNFAAVIPVKQKKAPSIINSPVAKLMTPVAL